MHKVYTAQQQTPRDTCNMRDKMSNIGADTETDTRVTHKQGQRPSDVIQAKRQTVTHWGKRQRNTHILCETVANIQGHRLTATH